MSTESSSSGQLDGDTDFAVVSTFSSERVKQRLQDSDESQRSLLIHKLWDSILSLLNKYSQNGALIETICHTFTQSCIYGNTASHTYPSSERLVSLFLISLSSLSWSNQSVSLIDAAVEVSGSLMDVFAVSLTSAHIEQLSAFLSHVLDSETYGIGKEALLLSAGHAFPHSFSDRVLHKLHQDMVHIKLAALLVYYGDMTDAQLSSLLTSLRCFLDYKSEIANDFIEESAHVMILFAAQQFATSHSVQAPLWSLLGKLLEEAPAIVGDVNPEAVVPLLTSACNGQINKGSSIQALCRFINTYVSKTGSLLIEYCLRENNELVNALLKIMEAPFESDRSSEIESIAQVMVSFCCHNTPQLLKHIISLDIVTRLEAVTIQLPQSCARGLCLVLHCILACFPPDNSNIPLILRQMLRRAAPNELTELKVAFFSCNHLLPFHTLLLTPLTAQKREHLYLTIRELLKVGPSDKVNEWLTKEFMEIYIAALSSDASQYKETVLHSFIFTSHYITYCIKSKELVQFLCDQKLHEVAVEICLKNANYRDARVNALNFINCLLRTYQEHLKDIKMFAQGSLPDLLIQLAVRFGRGRKSEIGEQFGSVVLGLTADKSSSSIVHEKGLLDKLYTLVSNEYDPSIIRSAIHAVGNIALAGHPVKQAILECNFHKVLIAYIDREMVTADPNVLSACCRVLHILCSGDWAKREFAFEGLVEILIRLLGTRQDTPEIKWRPLALFSSLSFMSLCNRQYLVIESTLRSILELAKRPQDSKMMGYVALAFLASADVDSHLTQIRSLGVIEIIQAILTSDHASSNNDLKRWGTSLVEKGQLFTVSVRSERLALESTNHLLSALPGSINWPPKYSQLSSCKGGTSLVLIEKTQLNPEFPEGPPVDPDQTRKLGLVPDQTLFRIGRVYGSTHGLCSNCEKDGPSEELVFRPRNLTPVQYQRLVSRGWYRRGGVKMFRYRYNHNIECGDWETRVLLAQFDGRKRKSYRKVLRRMPEERLTIETIPTQFVQESYDLYNTYHLIKHDKPRKSEFSYCEHVVNSPMRNQTVDGMEYGTFHQLYRLDGKLVAVGVIDVVWDGVVSIYMWYDMSKEVTKLSFGVYSALKEIEFAKELSRRNPNIRYYYLQGWNGNNHKLAYKANYEPEEFYSPCTVVNWVSGLDGVKKSQDEYRITHGTTQQEQCDSASSSQQQETKNGVSTNEVVSGTALPLDREWYRRNTGRDTVDTLRLAVCLNDCSYMTLGDAMDEFNMSSEQRQMMRERYEELVLALGEELASNMIIDLKACQ